MDDGLFSLCRICNVHVAKYTCPRCLLQTCSLPCSRRHKLWASCSGIRDPTVFKPMSELATPSGIDHDYNFLHSIEHRVERSEKLIVEERGLVGKDELALARADEEDRNKLRRKRGAQHAGEEPIQRSLRKTSTTVQRAPKGMRRNLENETTWSRNKYCIHWQVEWIRESDSGSSSGRILGRVLGNNPIGEAYAVIMDEEKRRNLAPKERSLMNNKRSSNGRSTQRSSRSSKGKSGMSARANKFLTAPALQNPNTGAWSRISSFIFINNINRESATISQPKPQLPSSCHLYLLRPHTPSSYPKVLAPIDPSQSLEVILRCRTVLEFPTIYVLGVESRNLPDQFMLERDFLKATGQEVVEDTDTAMNDVKEDSGEEDSSDTSSSGSDVSSSTVDTDEDIEEGEILPTVWGSRA